MIHLFFVLLIRLAEGFPLKTFRYQNMYRFINAVIKDQGFELSLKLKSKKQLQQSKRD